jgi:nitrile hydratase subunit beta
MDGAHDLGGMQGFGPVVRPGGDLPYQERWEPRVFAISALVGIEGLGAGPGGRAVREEMDPVRYLAASYYERWLYSAERRLLRKGTIAPGDVEAMMERLQAGAAIPEHRDPGMAERILADLRTVFPMEAVAGEPRFEPGRRVRVKRLPDQAPYGETAAPEPVYSVAFGSQELWGPSEEPAWTVLLDLWESYLEPA